ncbi:hypothetical protein DL95DRAFT_414812 [Leptodontidium sp. 2 PMI_412]|nr:hypothetical protein DL95DRAFT_414812 [Leptodontidium sp. 2 PMI_412]
MGNQTSSLATTTPETPDTLRQKLWSSKEPRVAYDIKQLPQESDENYKTRCALVQEISKTFWIPYETNEAFDKRMEAMAAITAESIPKAAWSTSECGMWMVRFIRDRLQRYDALMVRYASRFRCTGEYLLVMELEDWDMVFEGERGYESLWARMQDVKRRGLQLSDMSEEDGRGYEIVERCESGGMEKRSAASVIIPL